MLRAAPLLVIFFLLACTTTDVERVPLEPVPRVTVVPVDPNATPIRRVATATPIPTPTVKEIEQSIEELHRKLDNEPPVAETIAIVDEIRRRKKLLPTATPPKPTSSPCPIGQYLSGSHCLRVSSAWREQAGYIWGEEQRQPNPSNEDAVKTWGCTHFRNVERDLADGQLTASELRRKMQEVANDLRGTSAETAARRVVAAITANDSSAFARSHLALVEACK